MRGGLSAAIAALVIGVGSVASAGIDVGEPWPLTPYAFSKEMKVNPELAAYVAARGYPDWVEKVEVDVNPPLDTHEIRVYYLRLNKEIAFTRAWILGKPEIALRLTERPIPDVMRERIQQAILERRPDLRAELAADRAIVAAQSAEEAADVVEQSTARVERLVAQMESRFEDRLYK